METESSMGSNNAKESGSIFTASELDTPALKVWRRAWGVAGVVVVVGGGISAAQRRSTLMVSGVSGGDVGSVALRCSSRSS